MKNSETGGLFPFESKELATTIKHHCSRCGTGYAGPECDPPSSKGLDQSQKEFIISRLLADVIGEDITRGGLRETPKRVVAAWEEWTSGYHVNIKELFKTFEDGAQNYDEMVVRKDIRIYSHCEHHLAPIIGTCTIAYIPNGKIVGLSKLDRLADAYARRLQVQERLTAQIADAIWTNLEPLGVGVYINAKHLCVETRGVRQHTSDTITCALRGAMREQPAARAEFLSLTNN